MPSSDDLGGGLSGFTNEKKTIDTIKRRIQQLPESEYALIVLDELYKSTGSQRALQLIPELLKDLMHPRVVLMVLSNELTTARLMWGNDRFTDLQVVEEGHKLCSGRYDMIDATGTVEDSVLELPLKEKI